MDAQTVQCFIFSCERTPKLFYTFDGQEPVENFLFFFYVFEKATHTHKKKKTISEKNKKKKTTFHSIWSPCISNVLYDPALRQKHSAILH